MPVSCRNWFTLFALLLAPIAAEAQSGKLDCAVLIGQDGSCVYSSLVPQRYELVITSECGAWHDRLKADNPSVLTFVYNSGTDNYTTPGTADDGWYYGSREHAWLKQRCAELGYSTEILYLHYYDNTVVSGYSIPGTYSTTMVNADSVSRLPVYLSYYAGSGVGRILVNFSHPITRQVLIEYAKKAWTDPQAGDDWPQSSYWDGLYLDNWLAGHISTSMGQIGQVSSGGRIAEHPTHATVGGSEAAQWYQEQMNLFARQLRDTLRNAASWSPDGRVKYLAANIANSWTDDFADPAAGGIDYLIQEYQYNPLRCLSWAVPAAYSRDSACFGNGVHTVYLSLQTTTPPNGSGTVTQAESLYDNLAWYYLTRSAGTYLYQMHLSPSNFLIDPGSTQWDTLSWRGCMDYEVGASQGRYAVLQSGTDPLGQPYTIYQRAYAHALVLLRPRAVWNDDIYPETAVTVTLPTAYREVGIDGSLGPLRTTFSLRHGRGLILATEDDGQSQITPPGPISPGDGAEVTLLRPAMQVANAYDPDLRTLQYQFQVDASNDFTGLDLITSTPADISAVGESATVWNIPQDLTAGESYSWRCRVMTTSGDADSSDWSSVFMFSISPPATNTCPTPPTASSPAAGAQISDNDPPLVVVNSSDGDGDPLTYEFVVCSDPGMAVAVASISGVPSGATTTSWLVDPPLTVNQAYYWRARASDGQCNSDWSAGRSFTLSTANVPPPVPVAETPNNGETVARDQLRMTVQNVVDPDGDEVFYQFGIFQNSATVEIADDVPQGGGSTTSWQPAAPLQKNISYTWRAQSCDQVSYSGWTAPRVFYIQNVEPPVPAPISPMTGDTLFTQNVVLELGKVTDPDDSYVTYDFQVFSDPGLSAMVEQATGVEAGESNVVWPAIYHPQNNTTYYWHGRADDGTQTSSWSEPQAFFVSWLIGDVAGWVPDLSSPIDGATVYTLRPSLEICVPLEAIGAECEFVISTDAGFHDVLAYSGELPVASDVIVWSPRDDLRAGNEYYWRARLVGGKWSATGTFVVEPDIHFAPNPYALSVGGTVVIHNLPAESEVQLYTVSGRLVVTLESNSQSEISWDVYNDHGERLAPGVYLFVVRSPGYSAEGKFVVSR